MTLETDKKVSIIIPIYNEEKYIKNIFDSLLNQDYPRNSMEWIFIDGGSKDNTRNILDSYEKEYPEIVKIFENPNKTQSYAMNIGIKESSGKFIIRMDAHVEYSKDYISKCIYFLITTDADNVGGIAETKGKSTIGNIIALMLSSRFGVGNSKFRINGKSGFVDTVPFGAFRRTIFMKYGGFDERLVRNEDNAYNFIIRKNGGKIYLANDIRFTYYCRDNINGIAKMALENGKWNVVTMRLYPGSMSIRHFIPLFFILSLIILPCFFFLFPEIKWAYLFEIILYFLIDIYYSLKLKKFLLVFLYPLFHIAYGLGSLTGLFKTFEFF